MELHGVARSTCRLAKSSSIKMCQYPVGPTGYGKRQMERWRFLSAVGSRNREQYQSHHLTFKVVNIWRRRRSKEKGKEQTSWSYWSRISSRTVAMYYYYSILECKHETNWTFQHYVDDAAFILLNREDAVKAATLIVRHFRKFGLTIHVGNRVEGSPSI